jgi:hypothetical protein
VKTYRALQRLWQPPVPNLASLAGVLRSHWQAARLPSPAVFFGSSPMSWLDCRPAQAQPVRAADYHLTSGGKLIR